DRVDERAALDPGVVLGERVRGGAGRRVAGIEIGAAHAFGRTRQELRQNAAGAPVPAQAVRPGAVFLGDGEAHAGRYLLRAAEIFMRGSLEAAAVERHHALVPAHVRALVDGHGEMTAAHERAARSLAGPDRGIDPRAVESRAGA